MDFDIAQQLAVIAEEESAAIYHFTLIVLSALAVTSGLLLAVLADRKSVRRVGFGGLLICAGVLAASSVPKPKVEAWPEGVTNNGSFFDTNAWRFVEFRWNLREGYPQDQPLSFKYRPRDLSADWAALGSEPSGSRARRFVFADLGILLHPTNCIYLVESSYVPPRLPSIEFVSSTASNVTIEVTTATNYFGYAAMWECRRQMHLDTRLPVWGPWTEIGQPFDFETTRTNIVVRGQFVNERRNTEIRLKMMISNETSEGVRP